MQLVHGVILCKSARRCLPVAVQEVVPRVVHSLDYEVKAYFARVCKEICKAERIYSPHGGYGVALYAGYLHKSGYGVAGESQVVLYCDFCGVFYLSQPHFKQLSECGGSHRARRAYFCLTAAFCAAYGGVCLYYVAYNAACSQRADYLFV